MNKVIRLQKYLARCGIASRRKSEEIIAGGRVTVDGQIITEQGVTVDPARQEIRLDGKRVFEREEKLYLLLNKPKGYVTTLSDPQKRPIVTDLIQEVPARLFPVGRLDVDTRGALLLTNDGELAQKIQHPSYTVFKTYEAVVRGFPAKQQLALLEKGIMLEGKKTAPARIQFVKRQKNTAVINISIHEGRKRQVRKMFQAINHPVLALKRLAYGNLFLKNLPEGRYRPLTPQDLEKIFQKNSLQTKK